MVDKYLATYIARTRTLKAIRSFLWALVFANAWLRTWGVIDQKYLPGNPIGLWVLIPGAMVTLAILVRPVAQLFRRQNLLAAAIEIEIDWPEFDQRLITVASQNTDEPLLDHLRWEVLNILKQSPGKVRVSMRPLLIPALILIVMLFVFASLHLKRFYSPVSASSKINSTSTLASSGKVLTPTAARTCLPGSPKFPRVIHSPR